MSKLFVGVYAVAVFIYAILPVFVNVNLLIYGIGVIAVISFSLWAGARYRNDGLFIIGMFFLLWAFKIPMLESTFH